MKKLTSVIALIIALVLVFGIAALLTGCSCGGSAKDEISTVEGSGYNLPEDVFDDYVTPNIINEYVDTLDELQQKETLTEAEQATYDETAEKLKVALPSSAEIIDKGVAERKIDIPAIREKAEEYKESIIEEHPEAASTEGMTTETDVVNELPTDESGNYVLPTVEGHSAVELPKVYFN